MSWQTDFCRAYLKKRGSGRVELKTVLLPRETGDFSGNIAAIKSILWVIILFR